MQDDPQIILICCEGKITEKLYFEILKRVLRVSGVEIEIFPKVGQHRHLIDKSAAKKQEFSTDRGFAIDDIEVWAVCDRDSMKESFTKLDKHAAEKGVNLAFSDPQFENYLLQHFGSPNNSRKRRDKVEQELTSLLMNRGMEITYDKSDLSWLETMIDEKPRLVEEATRHADTYSVHSEKPFFTVQQLVRRILSFRVR